MVHWKEFLAQQGQTDVLTEIHRALAKQKWATVRQLLSESPSRGKQRAPGKKMPLHYAVEFNAPVDIIDSLLEIAPKALKKKTSKKDDFLFSEDLL